MEDEIRYKIAFSMIKNMNASLAQHILEKIETPEQFFKLSARDLERVAGLPSSIASGEYRASLEKKADDECRFVVANGIKVLFYDEPDYPARLRNCEDAPAIIYQYGNANPDTRHIVSIVGTRHATPYGIDATNRIVGELAEHLDDLVIVSGLAYGIDVSAHRAALDHGVPTIAITAHPLNTIYPADHRGVAAEMIRKGGAILTEYPTSREVYRANFLERNRIIAGIADCTIIVESDAKGGSMVTGSLALDYNREVFAVPGRLTDKYSRGCLNMINSNRAILYTSAEDLISVMGWSSKATVGDQAVIEFEMTETEKVIHDYLTNNPGSVVNDIMVALDMPLGMLKDALFDMEMKDLVMSVAGGRYTAL